MSSIRWKKFLNSFYLLDVRFGLLPKPFTAIAHFSVDSSCFKKALNFCIMAINVNAVKHKLSPGFSFLKSFANGTYQLRR